LPGRPWGESQVRYHPRRISRAHPGPPWLTSAAPDRGERRRPALTRQNGKGNVQVDVVQVLAPRGRRLERILSTLAREWLRITNRLLIVEDPELALRSPNKLMRVNGAERRKVVGALSGSQESC
jgi:hypothetical protein